MILHSTKVKRKLKRQQFIHSIVAFMVFVAFLYGVGFIVYGREDMRLISPIVDKQPKLVKQVPTTTVTPTPTLTEREKIQEEIKLVFNEHADKAFQLLQDKACHENLKLDPKAKNTNRDEIRSTDWGVFQINDHWQGVSNRAFLTDYKINVRMAWNIYERSGYTFKMWTCGKRLGI